MVKHKNDYSAIVFFKNEPQPKKWSYVHNLEKFGRFLNSKHPDWLYMNIYDRRSKEFKKRFRKENPLPQFLL